jgi:hypothetical protein
LLRAVLRVPQPVVACVARALCGGFFATHAMLHVLQPVAACGAAAVREELRCAVLYLIQRVALLVSAVAHEVFFCVRGCLFSTRCRS